LFYKAALKQSTLKSAITQLTWHW